MSIDAVAVDGMTFDASAPTRELAMPRMFSDGRVISSVSDWPSPSVDPSRKSRINSRSMFGASATAFRSAAFSGATSS